MKKEEKIIAEYYTKKIEEHGVSPEGVDWNGTESQELRFLELMKVIDARNFSIIDVGCGYGALLDYMVKTNIDSKGYLGVDLSKEMVKEAKNLHPKQADQFDHISRLEDMKNADYAVASGIFNVRLTETDDNWINYIKQTLTVINSKTSKGFSFNILTSYSDEEKKRDYLYYASPEELFAFCKNNFSRNVALLHDYNLYEFSILVRK
ncbi:MAG: class I SAM-dependent methyltransferase [Cryomorphaceae bacterium]